MVDDLVRQKTLIGKSREEVVELLGDDQKVKESRLIYRVGSDGMIDDTWLEIQFVDAECQNVLFYPD